MNDIGIKEIKVLAKLYLTDDEDLTTECILAIHNKMDLSVGSCHLFKVGKLKTSGSLVAVL